MKKKITILFVFAFLSAFVLTGCGKDDKKENLNNNNTNNSGDTTHVSGSTVHSDNNKIVFKNEQTKMVFYYEGNKITAYHVYVDYGDEATANMAIKVLKENKDENIDSMAVEGQYIVLKYKQKEYENYTVDGVRQMYSYLEEIKN